MVMQMKKKAIQPTSVRLPDHLKEWLIESGKKANRSMNGELVNLLATLKAKDLEEKLQEGVATNA